MKISLLILTLAAVIGQIAHTAPLKVYILAGQSNMEGHAHISTFPHVGMDPKTKPLLDLMQDESGKPRTAERVWISYLGAKNGEPIIQEGKLTAGFGAPVRGPKIGPEFTMGLTLEQKMENPILLIKTAWGGQNITLNFRPPSAGPKTLVDWQIEKLKAAGKDPADKQAELNEISGHRYRDMLNHVNKVLADPKKVCPDYNEKDGYEIAGFVWFQGWNDKVDKGSYPNRDQKGGYDLYSEMLTTFIKDVRKDLKAPNMPFIVGVMGVDGKIELKEGDAKAARNQYFRDAMAAPAMRPKFKGNVRNVFTEIYWDDVIGELETRRQNIKTQIKAVKHDKKLSEEERSKKMGELKAGTFTQKEQELFDLAVSNFGFHYLGSSKIVGQIGVAFANALLPPQLIGPIKGQISGPCKAAPGQIDPNEPK